MKIVQIERELIVDPGSKYERKLQAGESYLFSDTRTARILALAGEHIGAVTDISTVYKPYKGEPLNGKTILVWRHGGIGDLMFMMPPMRLLKNKYPDCKILAAVGSNFIDVYRNIPYINGIMPMPINANELTNADYHLQFEGIIENSKKAEKVNAYDLFLEAFGFDPSKIPDHEKRPDIFITDSEDKHVRKFMEERNITPGDLKIGIQIQASAPIRTYPVEKTKELCRRLIRRGAKIILFGGPYQQRIIENIKSSIVTEIGSRATYSVFSTTKDKLSIRHSMALTRYLNLMIAPDSAMIHVAGALGTPVIGLYGPFPADLRMRYYYNAIGLNAKSACAPCFKHGHEPCMKGAPSPCFSCLSVSTILIAIDYLLTKTGQTTIGDMDFLHHTEFSKVQDLCNQYMKGTGVDYGCGFMRYKEGNVARIDMNPLCDPDICINFSELKPKEQKANFVISSFSVNTIEDLNTFLDVATKTLVNDGYLILYVGNADAVSTIDSDIGKLSEIKDSFLSKLSMDDVISVVGSRKFKLISTHINEKAKDELLAAKGKEAANIDYGILTIWQKTN